MSKPVTIFELQEIIKNEDLKSFRDCVESIKNTPLHQQLKTHYCTQNLLNSTQSLIQKSNNDILIKEVLDFSLAYLKSEHKSELVKTCVQEDKMQHYHYLKKELGDSFYGVISDNFSTIATAWKEGNPEFKVWIKNIPIDSQTNLENIIRTFTLMNHIPLSHINYFASRLESNDILYTTLAYASRNPESSQKVHHLFGLLIPDLDDKLLLSKLKSSLNIREEKHENLKTDNLLEWCDNYAQISKSSILVLKKLLNSFYLNNSLQNSLENNSVTKKNKI